MNNLKDKVAVVTGSGQGIGRAIAMAMAAEGAKVVTNNRKPGSTGFAIMNQNLVNSLDAEKQAWLKKEAEAANGDAETTAAAISCRRGSYGFLRRCGQF
jgi:3-oxoacyl-[acyl-carrier protein] reductase